MLDDATIITRSRRAPTEELPLPRPTRRAQLTPVRRMTRAHVEALRHPRVVASWLEASVRIATRLTQALHTEVTVQVAPIPGALHPFANLAHRSLFALLEFGGTSTGAFELDGLGVGQLIAQLTRSDDPPALPSRLTAIEEAALGWFFLTVLAELRSESALRNVTPRLLALTLERSEVLRALDSRESFVGLELQLRLGTQPPTAARVLVPAAWLSSFFTPREDEGELELHASVGAAALSVLPIVGSTLLAPADAAALTAGDVVVFSGVTSTPTGIVGPGRLIGPSFELRGTFSPTGFTLTRAFERPHQESHMSLVDPAVPIEVEVELTRLRVPVHQLGAIRTGGIVPLHISAAQHVLLRIGDKAIARAELVELDGEIGARIVAML